MRGEPRAYLTSRGVWPTGPFKNGTPRTVYCAAEISRRLAEAIEANDLTKVDAAAKIGIARTTLYDILVGANVPDLYTVVEAEFQFGVRLWPESVSGSGSADPAD